MDSRSLRSGVTQGLHKMSDFGAATPAQASDEPKKPKGRSGKRLGAGRKPNYLKRLGIEPLSAAKILAPFDELDLWRGLLNHKSPSIKLQTLQYLTDRRDGKARQAVS